MENTRVRLKLTSWAVVCPSLCSHLCTMLGIGPAEESPAPLGFWLRVYLSLSYSWASSGALGMFPAYAMAEIAPLWRSLVNIQKRKCRSTAGVWSPAGLIVFVSCWRTAGPQNALGFTSNSSVCGFFLFVLVFIVCRWQVKGTLTFAPCVYERLGLLLSGTCKRSVVILC